MITIKEIENKDNLLIICPTSYKNKLLEDFSNEKKIVHCKFMTISEYKKNYYFDVDIDAIKYLCDKHSLSPKNAKEIITNLIYVEDKEYDIEKLDLLVKYKKELEDNKLLIKNNIFKNYLKDKNIMVLGYGKLSFLDSNIIEGKTVEIIEDEEISKKYTINTFEDIEQEVEFVYNSIFELLNKGIDINKIYILNVNDNYPSYFKRFNTYYDFKVDLGLKTEVVGTYLGQRFISMLEDKNREDIYNYLITVDDDLSSALIRLLNKYAKYDLKEVKELIIDDLKSLEITKNYKDVVRCVNLDYKFNDDEYVFLIGFSDLCPTMKKDVSYITNNIRGLVGMPSIEEENILIKLNTRAYLSNINNLIISYSEGSPFNDFNKQIIFEDDKVNYVKGVTSFKYSNELNKRKYASMLDSLHNYDIKDENIESLYKAYDKNNYLEYDNSFNKLSNEEISSIKKQINSLSSSSKKDKDKLTLSYSSIDKFYKCNFWFYLESVLGIKKYESNFSARLGTICHGVLQDYYKDRKSFNFDNSWDNQVLKYKNDNGKDAFELNSEIFFANKIKEELREDVDIIKKQNANSILDEFVCENNFTYGVDDNIDYTGFADKLMYKEKDGKMYAAIVDYKTGKNVDVNRELMDHGLSLQLPTYLYLLRNAKNYSDKDIEFIGFYLQRLINYDLKYDIKKTLKDKKNDSMKLDGISTNDLGKFSALDISLGAGNNSSTVAKVYIKKDGNLSTRSKGILYSDTEFDELSELVEDKVIEAGEDILSGDFTINPKIFKGKNKSCEYCPYVTICYKRSKDNQSLDGSELLENEEEQEYEND